MSSDNNIKEEALEVAHAIFDELEDSNKPYVSVNQIIEDRLSNNFPELDTDALKDKLQELIKENYEHANLPHVELRKELGEEVAYTDLPSPTFPSDAQELGSKPPKGRS